MTNILLRTIFIVGLIGMVNTVRGEPAPEGPPTLVTPGASPEAKALLRLLHEISGKYTLTGQHNFPNTKDTYTLRTAQICGKTPAVFGQEFGFAAPGNQDAAAARPDIIAEIKRQHEKGSIITLCWRAVRPTDDEPVTFRDSVQGKLTDQQWNDLLTPGTELHKRWCAQVDVIAGYLKELQAARVPVLWRPYHEMNGDWFWWGGRRGTNGTIALYHQLFDRFQHHHKLNNLVWVWSVDRPTGPQRQFADYFPGTNFFDVAALDVYQSDFKQDYYEGLVKLAAGKPVALAEVGPAPTLAVLNEQPQWAWWMTWAGFVGGRRGADTNALRELVNAPRSLSLDDPAYPAAVRPIRAASSEQIGDRSMEAPSPPSPVISSLKWDDAVVRLKTRAGDNWPITWAEGGLQITAWGDGPGFDEKPPRLSLGFAHVWGDPPNLRAEDFVTDADTPEGGGLYTFCLKKATLETRQTRFYCDPHNGSMQGDGSAEQPWRTIEEVIQGGLIQLCDQHGQAANPNAPVKPGDTVLLRSGWHGVLSISGAYNSRPITIAAAPGQAPQVGWVEIGEGQNWIVRGLTVSPSLAPTPLEKVPRELVSLGERGGEGSADLVVEDCFVYSVLDTTNWTGKDWVEKPASGIWLGRHGKHHVARNNYVLNTRFGIQLCAPDCVAEGNVVANFSADGMRATRDGQVLQYNVIKNNFVGSRDGDDNHDDGIQVFLFNVGTGTVRDVTLRGNIIIARETDGLPFPNPLQGIGCFDGPLVHFLVESNVVCVNHYHGISLYDAQNCTIQNNTCFSRWPDRAQPWIMLGQKKNQAGGNTVRNNLAHSYNFKADAQITTEGNAEIDPATFNQKLRALLTLIDTRFGSLHPTAKRPRLEPDSARNK